MTCVHPECICINLNDISATQHYYNTSMYNTQLFNSGTESEAPAVNRWAVLVRMLMGYLKR